MSLPPTAGRFHALDATRAFALMLGVVFHAAWSFVPQHTGAPIVDSSAHGGFHWFFFTAHSFRMQVFFLIAGFFARLLYHKRGWAGFAWHRFTRILLPMIVGWGLLSPLVIAAWVWGANTSGANMPPVPLPVLFDVMYAKSALFTPQSSGGMFNLIHLWFLYYLLWLYVAVLTGRAVLTRVLPRTAGLRQGADRLAANIATSPWSLAWLVPLTGLFLWRMDSWDGVDTPLFTLAPSLPVTLLYGSFFVLGWLWHRQSALLQKLAAHWKWQIGWGLVASLACFFALLRLANDGYLGSDLYPHLSPGQIADHRKFADALKSAERDTAATPELNQLWQHLPAPARAAIAALPAQPSPDAVDGMCSAINGVLFAPGLFAAGPLATASPAAPEAPRLSAGNRATLERILDGALNGDPRAKPGYAVLKLAYSLGYAAMMWLLALGTLGLFQALCAGQNPAWRYVADSAYWIYLMHLPLVAALQVGMAGWPLPAILKLPLLLAVAFAVLFATYHYLVRSTLLGQVLNGQRHPFTPTPFAFPSQPAVVPVFRTGRAD